MRLKVLAATMALAALVASPNAQADDPANFDFFGWAIIPSSVGGALTMRSVVVNNGVVPTPIPLDFTNYQHTLVVTGTLASIAGFRQYYNPAFIEIWSDPIVGGTAADYLNPVTFTDGELILSGVFHTSFSRTKYPPPSTTGSYLGTAHYTGGTRVGELGAYYHETIGGGLSTATSGRPAGYSENWDGKMDPVAVLPGTWDRVKGLYR